jgi:uncharacterized protein
MKNRVYLLAGIVLGTTLLLASGDQKQAPPQPWRDAGVINLKASPAAKLHTVPVRAVTIQEGFWSKRRKTAVEQSLPSVQKLMEAHGWLDNFRRISEGKNVLRHGPVFTDSDVYKWLEAVGYFLQSGDYPELRAVANDYINLIVKTQEPSGYLNTYWVEDKVKDRLTPYSMDFGHELYCLGHMTQAAVAYYRATGDRRLLDAAIRYADYLARNFGPEADRRPLLAGHPEIEMSLIELYRTTGDRRFLDLAGYILHGDSRIIRDPDRVVYTFSGIPFVERTQLEGHAVRAMYACSGATDYYMETGDPQYWSTLEHLWNDLVTSKMYITGGLGARWEGESIGAAYELPNSRAYAETCAAIANGMWNWRMLSASGDARYADVFERALYNGINVGMSLDGKLYCYYNPLEFDGKGQVNRHTRTGTVRNPWYDVLCCPPNIQRTLGALPGYFYSTSKDGIYVHLFDNSVLNWHLEDGTGLKITQKTNYPWDGTVEFTLDPAKRAEFTFFLRIPVWSRTAEVRVNGKQIKEGIQPGSYLPIRRRWREGDKVRLDLNMSPQLMEANSRLEENVGRVAVQRGPLVYCLEQIDQPGVNSLSDVSLALGKKLSTAFKSDPRPDLLGGVVVLRHPGIVAEGSGGPGPLYRPISAHSQEPARKVGLTFIPYYTWANREPSAMRVWLPYGEQ